LGGHFTRATGSCTSGSSIRAYFAWLGITSGLRAGVIGASSTSGWLLLSPEGNLCVGGCMGISGHHSMLENRFASRDCSLYRHSTTTHSDYNNHWAAHGAYLWVLGVDYYALYVSVNTTSWRLHSTHHFGADLQYLHPTFLSIHLIFWVCMGSTLHYYCFVSYTQQQLHFTLHRGSAPHFIFLFYLTPHVLDLHGHAIRPLERGSR